MPIEIERVGRRLPRCERRAGLAEIELPSMDTAFERPAWLGAEVTDDHRYRSASLAQRPFGHWVSDGG